MPKPGPKGHLFINRGAVREGCADKPLPKLREIAHAGPVIPILSLQHRHCCWPIGDPSSEGFGFCGAERSVPSSYCSAHAQIARGPKSDTKPYDPDRRDGRRHNGFHFAKKRAVGE